ncbi:WD40 repeat-like protein [Neolentinus lepideus HHB14362 ss-1]|uniref:WD40 repeat-like protein n=1 Tax=Neolentinus lepideus HHB14362 ss-1 TaxID=1314782 RepID=A0A165P8F5_9AGAM|nr:WD40 repeat-like protein [Neolentinus lepideus HHB14362 ss-1]
MSLVASESLAMFSKPLKSMTVPSGSYVLSLASLPSCYAASTSAPSNTIHLYDKSDLRVSSTLGGHEEGITTLRMAENIAGNNTRALVSSGRDGTVAVWDERSGSMAIQMRSAGRPRTLLSCDVSLDGLTVAAGTELQGEDALIQYWDPRHPAAPLRTHSMTHSDDITALHFRPSQGKCKNLLLSASSDGLVSTSNADEDDEDEAVLHVGNWSCSIAQAGWFTASNSESPVAWASSDMETFSVWSSEMDLVRDFDIRSPSIHSPQLTWVTDYLIGCHHSSKDLYMFGGSNEGDIALINSSDLSSATAPWHIRAVWSTGHVGVVRAHLWDERASRSFYNNVLLTGGEDSKLNLWSGPPVEVKQETDAMNIDTPPRKRDYDVEMEDTSDHGMKRVKRS